MTFQSDYTPIWESGASPGSGDFEDVVTVETNGNDDLGPGTGSNSDMNAQTNGPLSAAVETTGLTREEIELAAELAKVALALIAVYGVYNEGI